MPRTKEFERAQVLEKALTTFLEKGFAATSIQDLVTATEVNRQSLYNEFGDKQKLYILALEAYCSTLREEAKSILESQQPARMILEKYKNAIKENLQCGKASKGCMVVSSIMGSSHADAEVKAVVEKLFSDKLTLLAGVIARGQQAGELPTKHTPIAIAQSLHASLSGMSVMARSGAQPEELIAILDVAFEGLA